MSLLEIVVVCEALADRMTAGDLADRVLIEDVDWLEEDHLPHVRRWRGLDEQETFIPWKRIGKLAREHGLPPFFGHFGEEPGEIDAQSARNVLTLIKALGMEPAAVFLIRDGDNQAEQRRRGLEQARAHSPLPTTPIVIGLAIASRESWVLSAFDPRDDREQGRLDRAHRELGYDPRLYSERLTASDVAATHHAKRILELLCESLDRASDCCRTSPLATLFQRGNGSGLVAYLGEVREHVVPLLKMNQQA